MSSKTRLFSRTKSAVDTSAAPAAAVSQPVTHFAILIPGTGPQLETERPKNSFMQRARSFRSCIQDTCAREFPAARVEVAAIHYHADIQGLSSTRERLLKSSLSSIPWVRKVNAEVLGDIFYYFSTFHGRQLLAITINKLNAAHSAFLADHPSFSGPISLIAHSLGGMLTYEILYYINALTHNHSFAANVEMERYRDLPRLNFTPDRLFALGSPIGGTAVFRNLSLTRYNMGSVGFHNIFHPYDPCGYRTEPLCDDFYADVPAVPIVASSAAAAVALSRNASGLTLSSGMLGGHRRSRSLFTALVSRSRARDLDGSDKAVEGRSMSSTSSKSSKSRLRALLTSSSSSLTAVEEPELHADGHNSEPDQSSGPDESLQTDLQETEQPQSTPETPNENSGSEDPSEDFSTDNMLNQLLQLFATPQRISDARKISDAQGLPISTASGRRSRRPTRSHNPHKPHSHKQQQQQQQQQNEHEQRRREARARRQRLREVQSVYANVKDKPLPDLPVRSATAPAATTPLVQTQCDDASDLTEHPLPYAERMDYIIPVTKSYLQNEYWLGFHAHHVYWSSKEVVYHILHHMVNDPAAS
ncbi:hypothetical protein GGI05_003093, partial [Coemansia sp. RSA 2603]